MLQESILAFTIMVASSPCYVDYNVDSIATINSTNNENNFTLLGGFPSKALVLDCKDGYVYYNMEVYKTPYTTKSNLYLLHVITEWTPGYIAYKNTNTKYDESRSLSKGYVHLALERYIDEEKSAYGPKISPKVMWPLSSETETTITSSYGFSLALNNSLKKGITFDNGSTLSINANSSNASSLTFTYSKTQSSVSEDPRLSVQTSSENSMEAQWYYEVNSKDIAGRVTYSLETYYLFEMDNYSYVNANKDAFILNYSVEFISGYQFLWWWNDGYTYTSNVKIYNFI
jgi:hypothetical protein